MLLLLVFCSGALMAESESKRPRDRMTSTFNSKIMDGVEPQLLDNSCGIASLAYILNNYYHANTSEKNLFVFIGLKPEYSFRDLLDTARAFDIKSVGLKLTIDELKKIKSPTILKTSTNGGHFVVYVGYHNGWFQVVDPAKGRLNYYQAELEKIYVNREQGSGSALVFISKSKIAFKEQQLFNNSTNRLWLEGKDF